MKKVFKTKAMLSIAAMRSIALIAFVAVIGFTMTACKEDNAGTRKEDGNGELTITGIPSKYKFENELSGKYNNTNGSVLKCLECEFNTMYNAYTPVSSSFDIRNGEIISGTATLKVFKDGKGYKGSDKGILIDFAIGNGDVDGRNFDGVGFGVAKVDFTNGQSTIKWEDIDLFNLDITWD